MLQCEFFLLTFFGCGLYSGALNSPEITVIGGKLVYETSSDAYDLTRLMCVCVCLCVSIQGRSAPAEFDEPLRIDEGSPCQIQQTSVHPLSYPQCDS